MKKVASEGLTAEQRSETDALAALPEEQIDTRDIPEQRDWSGARRGVLFRPVKRQITLRLDADLIEWFRSQPEGEEGYQTRINRALREYVQQHDRD
jgi:uncharacterized protein (DUF4415 family)